MKHFLKHLSIFIFLVALKTSSQAQTLSPTPLTAGGYFDEVYDKDGNKYNLKDLRVLPDDPYAAKIVSSTTSCTAGYFAVYFANGSGMELLNATHLSRRNVICEVLANLSGMVNPTFTSSATKVKILVDDITNYSPSVGPLGLATAFYSFPLLPANPNPGVVTNMIHKTIITGQDALTGIVPPMLLPGNGFYHGVMAYDFNNFTWHLGLGSLPPGGAYDLYTVALHEITHAMGFASLIDYTGLSKFGAANNYYSNYDKFLCNPSGTPLLTASTASCLNYNWVYTGSNTLVAPNGTTCSGSSNITSCPTAVRYISGNLPAGTNMKVYTPNCFEPPSSLSHFEDMCYPTPVPYGNDVHFVMSNANAAATFKRYLKEEERLVLCDIGYSCVNQYTSNAALTPTFGASHTYTSSNCSSPDIWGVNDGIVGGNYVYTSLTTTVIIPIPNTTTLGILNNDSPSTTTFSCLEDVYNIGVATISGTNIVYVANPGYTGPMLLRYVPVNAIGDKGNITYITGYVINTACNPVSPCNIVQNGGFENFSFPHITNPICGQISSSSVSPHSSCWENFQFAHTTPDMYTAGCTSGGIYNAGVNTYGILPPVTSHNGIPLNNSFVGFGLTVTGSNFAEAMKNYLGTPLMPGQSYVLSFMIRLASNPSPSPFNPNQLPLVVSFCSSDALLPTPTATYPSTLNVIQHYTLTSGFNTWVPITTTFTFNSPGSLPHPVIMFGMNYANTVPYGYGLGESCYAFIDDVSIQPSSAAPTLSLQPLLCLGNSILDLGQFAQPPGGVFSGQGVTFSAGLYDFNSSGTLTPGPYNISYVVTNTLNGCTSTAVSQVSVISTACCNSTLTSFTGTTFPTTPTGVLYSSPLVFINDIVVPPGQIITLTQSEFQFGPNVKIIVSPNAELKVRGAHLYACQTDMWQGIVVQDGGKLVTNTGANDAFIEDAIVAIDVSNHSTSALTFTNPILSLNKTIFNKNHVSVKIDNYQRSSLNYPFVVSECVFTSRNFTFTPSSWPSTSTSGSGLRVATNPTTGLAVPFL